jgi:hypothetical protein
VAAQSETDARAQLHLARILRAEDASEVGVAENAVRQVEVGAVEQVEDFPAELEVGRTADAPGKTPPEPSRTTPPISAVLVCATALEAVMPSQAVRQRIRIAPRLPTRAGGHKTGRQGSVAMPISMSSGQ